MNILVFLLLCFVWFVLSLGFHEFGHWFIARLHGLYARFGFNKRSLFVEVTGGNEVHDFRIGMGGVLFGLVPTLFAFVWFGGFVGVMLLLAYGFGVWGEFNVLLDSVK